MESLLSASARDGAGELSLPAMTIIAMLLLMLPYLIRRYSGRSVTELLRFSVLLDGMERLAGGIRNALFRCVAAKRGGASRKADARPAAKAAAGRPDARRAAENKTAESDRSRKRHRAENARNDYLKALSELLAFARKNRLFAIIPGNLAYQGKTAELDAILVTRARVVGILAFSYGGMILCRKDAQEEWQVTDDEGTRRIGNPTRAANAQDELVRAALAERGMGDIPYETVMLFTGSDAVLTGERPHLCCTGEELFRLLESGGDLNGPLPDPKETGKRISALRAGKTKKNVF